MSQQLIECLAAFRLESVWTVPSVDSTTGEVVFPLGAYFTSLASAETFYNLVNLKPQTIFSESAGLAVSVRPAVLLCCLTSCSTASQIFHKSAEALSHA